MVETWTIRGTPAAMAESRKRSVAVTFAASMAGRSASPIPTR